MSDFHREHRYLVAKLADVEQTLAHEEIQDLLALLDKVARHRASNSKPPLECVVVESDWPIYEQTWASVQRLWEAHRTTEQI